MADDVICMGEEFRVSVTAKEGLDHPVKIVRETDAVKINMSEVQIQTGQLAGEEGYFSPSSIVMVGGETIVRARIHPWWPGNLTVTIDSEGDGVLEFSKSGDAYSNRVGMTLPKSGAWRYFYATGKGGPQDDPWRYASEDVGDTYIVAHASPQEVGKDDGNTIPKITVEWLDAKNVPITTPNDDYPIPWARYGLKYYPGASNSGEGWNRDIKVRVTVSPISSAQKVYLKVFDPDDPSSNLPGPIDPMDIGPNETRGTDNRGGGYFWRIDENGKWHSSLFVGRTLEVNEDLKIGTHTENFRVSTNPGDNYRVAATLNELELRFPALTNDKVAPEDPIIWRLITSPEGFGGGISPLLTIWRKLYYEIDTMAQPTYTQNIATANWSGLTPKGQIGRPDNLQDLYEVNLSNFTTGFPVKHRPVDNQYESGFIRFSVGGGGSQDIIGKVKSSDAGSLMFTVPVGTKFTGKAIGPVVEIGDDDFTQSIFTGKTAGSRTVPKPDLYFFEMGYRMAYVTVINVKKENSTVPFRSNFEGAGDLYGLLTDARFKGLSDTDEYRTFTMGLYFQGLVGEDNDPFGAGATAGAYPTKWLGTVRSSTAAAFWEVCREDSMGIPVETFVGLTMAHETVHDYSALHDNEGFFVKDYKAETHAGDQTLNWIRTDF